MLNAQNTSSCQNKCLEACYKMLKMLKSCQIRTIMAKYCQG